MPDDYRTSTSKCTEFTDWCTIRAFHHFHVDDAVGFDDAPREVAAAVADVARRIPPAFPPVSVFDCQDSFLTMVVAISMMMVMMSGQNASSCCCSLPAVVVVEVVIDGSSWHSTTTAPVNNNKNYTGGCTSWWTCDINDGPAAAAASWSSPPPTLSIFYVLLSICWLETRRRREGCGTWYIVSHILSCVQSTIIPAPNSVLLFFTLF